MTFWKNGGITTAVSPQAYATPIWRWNWKKEPPLSVHSQKRFEVFIVSAVVWQSSAQLSLPRSCFPRGRSPSGWLLRIADTVRQEAALRQCLSGEWLWHVGDVTQPCRFLLVSLLIQQLVRCHSSCLSQVGLESHNSHFDRKQRAQPSVVRIWGWLIVRVGCWKLLLWQHCSASNAIS